MDTSEQYINMCRKAKELQEMWKPEEGDFYIRDGFPVGAYCDEYFRYYVTEDEDEWKNNVVWLPRIDQLLQILSDKNIIFGLSNYAQGDSVEITCIKLLYQNLYNKSWNGEDWI